MEVSMDDLHLTDEDLASFFTSGRKSKRVVRHLLSGCDRCRKRAVTTLETLGLDVGLLEEPTEGWAFQDLSPESLRVSALIEKEKRRAKVSFARLAPLSPQARLVTLRKHARYKKYGLVLYVLDEVESLILKYNRVKARELTSFSLAITDLLRPGVYGKKAMGDLRLRQQTTLSNVKRLEEDFADALATLKETDDLRHLGTDPREEARFFRVEADILYDLGEFEAATESSEERIALCQLVGDTQATAKAILQKAAILSQYDPETGLISADIGLSLLDPSDLHTRVCAICNRAICLVELDRAEDAAEYLSLYQEMIGQVLDPTREVFFLWLDAKIMGSRGNYRDAEELFSYVALRFAEEGMIQEMLLVHMDRIDLKVAVGRWNSALTLARRLTPELTRLGLRNDLLSMWATLQDGLAARQESLLANIRDFYRRRWNSRTGVRL
jgi:tetratricopeptide (TPR) repeat protein